MKKIYTLSFIAVVASLVLLGAGCSSTPTSTTNQPPTTQPTATVPPATQAAVSIANFSFQPSDVTIAAGGTITWTNNDSAPHTITADDSSFDSGPIAPGTTYSHTFSSAGSVAYHCSIHPSMHGSITVTQ